MSIPQGVLRLFALLIGIDEYDHQVPLYGAVADAEAFKSFLLDRLNVPANQITLLTNRKATRSGIIDALKKLKDDEDIREGNAILVFYAGHGTEINDSTTGPGTKSYKVQAIIPQDCNGQDIHPICDWAFGDLIGDIYRAKGDNITVIFDCCHSGSGTRCDGFRTRAVDMGDYKLPQDLDREIRSTALARGSRPAKGFLAGALDTHVLLAACSSGEVAREYNKQGLFTAALLELLRKTPVHDLTYFEVLRRLTSIDGQNPQCEGNNQRRILFSGSTVPSIHRVCVTHRQIAGGGYVIESGSMHGVSVGAEFDIYPDEAAATHKVPGQEIGKMIASNVLAFQSELEMGYLDSSKIKSTVYAVQTKPGPTAQPKLFVSKSMDKEGLDLVCKSLDMLGAVPNGISFEQVSDRKGASVEVDTHTGEGGKRLVFNSLDDRVTRHGLRRIRPNSNLQINDAASLLHRVAHYHHCLDFSISDTKFRQMIDIRFYRLQGGNGPFDTSKDRYTVGGNILKDDIIFLEVDETDEEVAYGIEIVNKSPRDLYPHVSYFDNSDLNITSYYDVGKPTPFQVDSPLLRSGGALTIGYGTGGGANAIAFYIPGGQDVDVGFFKFIFSTRVVDLSYITDYAPYVPSDSLDAHRDRGTRPVIPGGNKDTWVSILVPVVLRREWIQNFQEAEL